MGLTRLVIQRPLILVMALAAILVLGWRARMEMPAELDPRVEIPVVNIMTVYPGAGPEEVEQTVTRPLEDAVASVTNVTGVSSRSLEDVSFVTVRLKLGTDLNAAAGDLRARVDAARRDLPPDIASPQISKLDYNARPVMILGVTGSIPIQELRRLVDDGIKPHLSEVPGLGSVTVIGGRQREIHVEADPARLEAAGISLLDLMRPLNAASQSAPAGSLAQGPRDLSVRVLGEFKSLEDLRNTPVPTAAQAAGMQGGMAAMGARAAGGSPSPTAPLLLRDVATVRDALAEREQITRVGRRESIGLVLSRVSDANTVQVAEGIRAALRTLTLPEGVRISVLQDNSRAVSDALEDINATLVLGSLLAVLVVWLFLHSLKDTLIVAAAIPTSIIATFIVMYFAGFSMNQMTMLALSLSVGILVDDSILVLECIHRHRSMGKDPVTAALDGRREIGLADAANTFVDVIVFLPIAFMGGIVGQFFREFGLTIAAATLASLYVSFTLTPMLAARWYGPRDGIDAPTGRFSTWFDRQYAKVEALYRRLLAVALRRRGLVVATGFGSLALMGLLSWQVIGFDFTPSIDRGEVNVQMELPPGASLEATDALMRRVEDAAAVIPEVDQGRMLASVGEIIGGFGSLPDRGAQFGQLTLMLQEKQGFLDRLLHPFGQPGRRNRSDEAVASDLRRRLRAIPDGDRVAVSAARGLTSNLAPVTLSLYGNDVEALQAASDELSRRMSALPELRNVDSTMRRGKPELRVVVDRERLADSLATPAELTGVVRTAVAGNTDLAFRDGDRSIPIRLRLQRTNEEGRPLNADDLSNLLVAQRGPSAVYVGDIADVRMGAGPTKILRSHRVRRAVISAHVVEGVSLGAAQAAVDRVLAGMKLGPVRAEWEGDVDDMKESAGLMAGAIILAILLSYMLMAALFNDALQPLTIMSSVPMALVGGLLGLISTGITMNIVSMIGIVMLIGLVSKNAILLVDYTNTLRAQGLSRNAALQAAGPVRLRPILMTTISTICGMLPVALQIGRASEMRSPMAVVVIGGLLLSTLLTLLVIPVMYTFFDDFGGVVLRAWSGVASRESEPDAAPAPRAVGEAAESAGAE